ncbi:MAG: cytochrome c biogenesis protein CcsA [Chitinophagaceae bacterium]|jgi:cytochrome c-type biogenesis protein CcmF|nr:cytochrome c biogenesis protein CcsA [Chitinophagaceae bacterium]
MTYTGEHLLPGQIGYFSILLSFAASIVSVVSFYKSNKAIIPAEKQGWIRLARIAFAVETAAVVAIIAMLYYILSHHLFEYFYAFNHSDKTLQPEYIFSCLWEGQEGSFLLWSFWNCVLGWFVIMRTGKWEAPVMTVINFAQFGIATMLLGLYIGGVKIGTNPFLLLRNQGILDGAPIFQDVTTGLLRADYLSLIKDGSGLNATLQNYWMVIHPPVLFLGFASTIVPFAFAYSGLVNNDHSWTKKALPWTCFSGAALGTGIMMGAAWAYESLNFGGYWAWDPVENASLVPWLILIAGLHTNLVYNRSGYSLRFTYLMYILSFVFVVYSTYLTRSGDLGDSSVHSFIGEDMRLQLILFILIFFVPGMYLFFKKRKEIPAIQKEENTYSREFWMFIGALTLFLSAVIIIGQTSYPIYNKIFGTKISEPDDRYLAYNQIQIFIAIVIGILSAVTQYLRYKDTPKAFIRKRLWIPTLLSLLISVCIGLFGNIDYEKHGTVFLAAIHLAIFAAIYAVIANAGYIFIGLKGKLKNAGASVAHVGFGLVLVGILLSSAKEELLSHNTSGIAMFEKTKNEDPAESFTLVKGVNTDMNKYMVTYIGDTMNNYDRKRYFQIHFKKKDGAEDFTLYPSLLKNNKGAEGMGAQPNSKHFWNRDIFVYVSAFKNDETDTATFKPVQVHAGDTFYYSKGMILFNKAYVDTTNSKHTAQSGETLMTLDMTVIASTGKRYDIAPGIAISNNANTLRNLPDSVAEEGLTLRFNRVADEQKRILEIGIKENNTSNVFITLKAIKFPFINILWIGIIITAFGFLMSVMKRVNG